MGSNLTCHRLSVGCPKNVSPAVPLGVGGVLLVKESYWLYQVSESENVTPRSWGSKSIYPIQCPSSWTKNQIEIRQIKRGIHTDTKIPKAVSQNEVGMSF